MINNNKRYMSSFSRAFAGELYLFSHRRSIRIAHIAVFVLAAVFAVMNLGLLAATAELNEVGLVELPAYNFWPQWAAATHTTMYLVELLVVRLLAARNNVSSDARSFVAADITHFIHLSALCGSSSFATDFICMCFDRFGTNVSDIVRCRRHNGRPGSAV